MPLGCEFEMNVADLLKIRALSMIANIFLLKNCVVGHTLWEPRFYGDSFFRNANYTETGWQAKLHDCFDSKKYLNLPNYFRRLLKSILS